MNNYRVNLPKQIIFLIILVFLLVLVFTIWFDSTYFVYLIWNIFLACIPFFISLNLFLNKDIFLGFKEESKIYKFKTKIVLFSISIFFWIIFFPNTLYLITDLIHLGANALVPFWFDVILLLLCAYIGLYLGLNSLFHIEQILLSKLSNKKTNFIIVVYILISSFGIYLGRFLRFNSWDVFVKPKFILNDVSNIFLNPENYKEAYISTIIFFIFSIMFYFFWRNFKKYF